MPKSLDSRAVTIAARVMVAAGLCRYDDSDKCRRLYVDESTCEKCVRSWLISKAKKEFKEESK